MTARIICLATKKFGSVEKKTSTNSQYIKNRGAEKITHVKYDLGLLKKQLKGVSKEERNRLSELCCILRKKLITLQRAQEMDQGQGEETHCLPSKSHWIYQTTARPEVQGPTHTP